MSRWFRYYDEALDDPKVQTLPDRLFKAWVNLMCVASKNGGVIPSIADAAFRLRLTETKAGEVVGELAAAGLLDPVEDGYFRPHNWNVRQFISDVSTDRVRAFRERQSKQEGNVSETANETPPETEQSRAEQNQSDARARRLNALEAFREFWKAKPDRAGANPRAVAEKIFVAKVKAGADPLVIVAAAKRWAWADRSKIGTEYIPQAITWLRQDRWADYPEPEPAPVTTEPDAHISIDPQWAPARTRLLADVGADIFASWFRNVVFVSIEGTTARMATPTKFIKAWIEKNYARQLLAAWQAARPEILSIEIVVGLPVPA